MEIKDLMTYLHGMARSCSGKADWFDKVNAPALSEYYRYAQSCVLDLIDVIHADKNIKTVENIAELVDNMRHAALGECMQFRFERIAKFAELAMVKFSILGEIEFHIERNS